MIVQVNGKPSVELSPEAVRLEQETAGDVAIVVLPIPPEAQPVDICTALCRFSSKRNELVVKWPCMEHSAAPMGSAPKENSEAATTKASENCTEEFDAVEEDGSLSAEAPSTEASSQGPSEIDASPTDEHSPDDIEASCRDSSEEDVAPPNAPAVVSTNTAEEWKVLGNEAVKVGDHAFALDFYSSGLLVDPDHAILLSNRALCLHKLGRLEDGLVDAKRCAALRSDFVKGFLRAAIIMRELGRPQEALELLRKAPLHKEVEKLSAEVRPEAEAAEERRIATLGGAERKKEEANALFKRGLFEQALPMYDDAFSLCSDLVGELALAIRNNRAGCYYQLSNFERVVEETSFVLEMQPDNLKALMRRMIAYEPLEKYEAALRDARAVLRQVPGHEAANRLQHRLSNLVRDQERERSKA